MERSSNTSGQRNNTVLHAFIVASGSAETEGPLMLAAGLNSVVEDSLCAKYIQHAQNPRPVSDCWVKKIVFRTILQRGPFF
jgi:hypothetical protein